MLKDANKVFPEVEPLVVKPDQSENTTGFVADWFFLIVMFPVTTTKPAAAPALEIVKFHQRGLEASRPALAPLCPRLTFTSKAAALGKTTKQINSAAKIWIGFI